MRAFNQPEKDQLTDMFMSERALANPKLSLDQLRNYASSYPDEDDQAFVGSLVNQMLKKLSDQSSEGHTVATMLALQYYRYAGQPKYPDTYSRAAGDYLTQTVTQLLSEPTAEKRETAFSLAENMLRVDMDKGIHDEQIGLPSDLISEIINSALEDRNDPFKLEAHDLFERQMRLTEERGTSFLNWQMQETFLRIFNALIKERSHREAGVMLDRRDRDKKYYSYSRDPAKVLALHETLVKSVKDNRYVYSHELLARTALIGIDIYKALELRDENFKEYDYFLPVHKGIDQMLPTDRYSELSQAYDMTKQLIEKTDTGHAQNVVDRQPHNKKKRLSYISKATKNAEQRCMNAKLRSAKQLGLIADCLAEQNSLEYLSLAAQVTKDQYALWPEGSHKMEVKYLGKENYSEIPNAEHQSISFNRAKKIVTKLVELDKLEPHNKMEAMKQATDVALWMSPPHAIRFNTESIALKQTLVDAWLATQTLEGKRQALNITRNIIKSSRWHYRETPQSTDPIERLIGRVKQRLQPTSFYGHQIDCFSEVSARMAVMINGVERMNPDGKALARAAAQLAYDVAGKDNRKRQAAYALVDRVSMADDSPKKEFQHKFQAFTLEINALLDQSAPGLQNPNPLKPE